MNGKELYTILSLIFSIIILSNCNEKQCDSKASYTMAVDSELTLLMRNMYNYYDSIKVDITNGTLTEDILIFQDIHKAVATSSEKSSSDLYQGMAAIYVQSAKRLNLPNINQKEAFNLMVDNCMNCHKQMCPGPMVRIKKLYLD